MIVRPFVAWATYTAGDYVSDPKTGSIYMVVKDGDAYYDGPVAVDDRTPSADKDHFVLATDLPSR